MEPPPFFRLAPAVLLGALGTACGGHKSAPVVAAACELPLPQASALPTVAPTSVPNPLTQAVAIAFGTRTTGDQITFQVPAGTASVDIVEQAASPDVPLTVRVGTYAVDNEPIPLTIDVDGTTIFNDMSMPPNGAFRIVNGVTVLDPLAAGSSLPVYYLWLYASAWTGSLTLPNTTTAIPGTVNPAGVPAGAWTVTVSDWAHECRIDPGLCTATTAKPSTYDVTVILKPAAAATGALKVVFHLVTNRPLTAATANAGGYPDLVRLQWAMTQILMSAGIAPTFQYRDVPADVRATYATGVDANSGGVCGDMDQLLQLAEAGNQLNVFLVDLIQDSSTGTPGYTTVGLDPIVPGAGSFGGTPASGVLVSIANLGKARNGPADCSGALNIGSCGDDVTAAIVAHEAGHFMGLYHDTDGIGTIVDPIADTPTCLCPLCKTGTGTCQGMGPSDPNIASPYPMAVTDCLQPAGSTPECGGGDNLMFWALDVGSKGLLTAGQAAVMRASPVVE